MSLTSRSQSRGGPAVPAAFLESGIAMQSREIINSILADPDPALSEVKTRLRQCMAEYGGAPVGALLAHMLETCRRANSRM